MKKRKSKPKILFECSEGMLIGGLGICRAPTGPVGKRTGCSFPLQHPGPHSGEATDDEAEAAFDGAIAKALERLGRQRP